MRIAIYGAGAIGGLLGAKLAALGEDVTLIARGLHLNAMQTNGVRINSFLGDLEVHPKATDDPESVGPVDYLVLAVKAHGLTAIAPRLAPMMGPDTAVISAQNGVPWWYFQRHGGPWEGTHLESVDPGGIIEKYIPAERIIGCVVYPAAVIIEPGVIEHVEGDRFSLGELDGASTERTKTLSKAITAAGLRAPVRSNIRQELWVKLFGNIALNPLSALTRATLAELTTDPHTMGVARAMMEESVAIAKALGIDIPITIDQRLDAAREVGHHKTSMLQDLEAAKPTELDGLLGAVLELGDMLGHPLPYSRAVYACTNLLSRKTLE